MGIESEDCHLQMHLNDPEHFAMAAVKGRFFR